MRLTCAQVTGVHSAAFSASAASLAVKIGKASLAAASLAAVFWAPVPVAITSPLTAKK